MTRYTLTVIKRLSLIGYDMRLKSYRELQSLMAKHQMCHSTLSAAQAAARAISDHVLVTEVLITQEKPMGKWKNGRPA